MRLFLVGDHKTGTGPANVTAALIKHLPENTERLEGSGKAVRLLELIFKMPFCDVCVLSGHSKQNIYALALAGFWHKKTIFIMHGCVEHENAINGVPDEDMNRVERQVLKESDLILAVSPAFEAYIRAEYPEYGKKTGCLINGVEWEDFETASSERTFPEQDGSPEKPYRLMTIGGGMPRKKVPEICEALQLLKEMGIYCRLFVAGDKGKDSPVIAQSPYAEDLGLISREEVKKRLKESRIFIQNSSFETFGLAPIEALCCGCSLLLSKRVGALCLFEKSGLEAGDVIENCEDSREIADKLAQLLERPNHDRLLGLVDRESTGYEKRAGELLEWAGRLCGR